MTKKFDKFIEEAASKRCPSGEYYWHTDEKCKAVPKGWHVGRAGYLTKDEDEENGQTGKSSNGTDNGSSSSNGGNGNGSNGGGNGG